MFNICCTDTLETKNIDSSLDTDRFNVVTPYQAPKPLPDVTSYRVHPFIPGNTPLMINKGTGTKTMQLGGACVENVNKQQISAVCFYRTNTL